MSCLVLCTVVLSAGRDETESLGDVECCAAIGVVGVSAGPVLH